MLCFLLIILQWFNEINDPCNGLKDYKFAHVAYSCIYNNYVTSFDLWMSKGGVNTFTLIINYLNEIWILIHVTIGLFEVHETIGLYVVRQL